MAIGFPPSSAQCSVSRTFYPILFLEPKPRVHYGPYPCGLRGRPSSILSHWTPFWLACLMKLVSIHSQVLVLTQPKTSTTHSNGQLLSLTFLPRRVRLAISILILSASYLLSLCPYVLVRLLPDCTPSHFPHTIPMPSCQPPSPPFHLVLPAF